MTVDTAREKPSPKVPHWLIRTIWFAHRRAYAISGGRFGLRPCGLSRCVMLVGTCHCGAVTIKLPSAPEKATSCNCSLCRRLGGLWAYYEFGTVQITEPGSYTITAGPEIEGGIEPKILVGK